MLREDPAGDEHAEAWSGRGPERCQREGGETAEDERSAPESIPQLSGQGLQRRLRSDTR